MKKTLTEKGLGSNAEPTAQFFATLAALIAPHLPAAKVVTAYSQFDGERPPGAGRAKYLRTHAAGLEAGDPGVWSEGRSRLMTVETWAKYARTKTPAVPVAEKSQPRTRDDEALEELGLTGSK